MLDDIMVIHSIKVIVLVTRILLKKIHTFCQRRVWCQIVMNIIHYKAAMMMHLSLIHKFSFWTDDFGGGCRRLLQSEDRVCWQCQRLPQVVHTKRKCLSIVSIIAVTVTDFFFLMNLCKVHVIDNTHYKLYVYTCLCW